MDEIHRAELPQIEMMITHLKKKWNKITHGSQKVTQSQDEPSPTKPTATQYCFARCNSVKELPGNASISVLSTRNGFSN